MRDIIGMAVLFTLAFVIMWGVVKCASDLPIVQISVSTGKCVDVWDKDRIYSCDNMPSKYEHVWVK